MFCVKIIHYWHTCKNVDDSEIKRRMYRKIIDVQKRRKNKMSHVMKYDINLHNTVDWYTIILPNRPTKEIIYFSKKVF